MEHYQITLTKQRLARAGSFRAELISDDESKIDPEKTHPMHRRVLKPILALATECYVYGLKKTSPLLERCSEILTPDRGRHTLDLSQEVVTGFEPLWNATAFECGSIVASVPVKAFDRSVLRYALKFYVIGNPNVSHTPAAIRHSRELAKAGKLAFCFTKHSTRNVQIYGPLKELEKLYLSLSKAKRKN